MSDEINKQATEGEEKPKSWKDVAEVRMVMYVVPVAIVLFLIAWILSVK